MEPALKVLSPAPCVGLSAEDQDIGSRHVSQSIRGCHGLQHWSQRVSVKSAAVSPLVLAAWLTGSLL